MGTIQQFRDSGFSGTLNEWLLARADRRREISTLATGDAAAVRSNASPRTIAPSETIIITPAEALERLAAKARENDRSLSPSTSMALACRQNPGLYAASAADAVPGDRMQLALAQDPARRGDEQQRILDIVAERVAALMDGNGGNAKFTRAKATEQVFREDPALYRRYVSAFTS
jgi:hypothetical protein